MISAGVTIFAGCPADDISMQEARKYIKQHGLTSEDVRLRNDGECVMVITKREVKTFDIEEEGA